MNFIFTKIGTTFVFIIILIAGFFTYSVLGDTTVGVSLKTSPSLERGLVGHWTFDGPDINISTNTIIDRSGQGNDGYTTGMSTATTTIPGRIGQGIKLNNNASVIVPDDTSIDLDDVTSWAFWIKDEGDVIWYQGIMGKGNIATGRLSIQRHNSEDNIYMRIDTTDLSNQTSSRIPGIMDGDWHHIVWVVNNSSVIAYKDGVKIDNDSYNHGNGFGTTGTNFTFYSNGSNATLLFDDVRIYNRALSAEEVKMLYNLGASTKIAKTVNSQPDLENGLVGHWTFDGPDITGDDGVGIVDSSGQGNHGQLKGVATTSAVTPGRIGQALEFDEEGYAVNIGENPSFDFSSQDNFTINIWVKLNPLLKNYAPLVGKANASSIDGYMLRHESFGNIAMRLEDVDGTGQAGAVTSGYDYRDDQWHNVVGIVDWESNSISIYVDGVLKGQDTDISNISEIENNTDLCIASFGNGIKWFLGSIDDVRIYNRALSAEEVQRLYNMGR